MRIEREEVVGGAWGWANAVGGGGGERGLREAEATAASREGGEEGARGPGEGRGRVAGRGAEAGVEQGRDAGVCCSRSSPAPAARESGLIRLRIPQAGSPPKSRFRLESSTRACGAREAGKGNGPGPAPSAARKPDTFRPVPLLTETAGFGSRVGTPPTTDWRPARSLWSWILAMAFR